MAKTKGELSLSIEQINEMDRMGVLPPYQGDEKLQLELIRKTKTIDSFEYEGLIIKGDSVQIVTRYCRLNPSKKFYVWLIDNCTIISGN